MIIKKINDFKDGWFIGNFEPSVFKTDLFEVCFKKHKKDEVWDTHYHKVAIEYNLLIKGQMTIQDIILNEGDVFILNPYEISNPVFLTDCEVLVIKTPSVINDKFLTH
jgi:hypothetical protein